MRVLAVAGAVAVAGCEDRGAPYAVVAAADLASPDDAITGPIEVLGLNSPVTPEDEDLPERTLAALHVRLPDRAAHRVALYAGPGCDLADLGPPLVELERIRSVDDETHFVTSVIARDGISVELDLETVTAPISLDPSSRRYAIGRVVVVDTLDGAPLACGRVELR